MEVREVRNEEEQQAVYRLTYNAYLAQGYCLPNKEGRLLHYPSLEGIPETTVFVAVEGGKVIGTNSCTVDGPEHLPEDRDFPLEMAVIRRQCENCGLEMDSLWRLVVSPTATRRMRTVLELMNLSMERFVNERDLHLFMFHPRHSSFWQRVLDLDIAERRSAPSVNGAPAVLAKGWPTQMKIRWRKICQKRGISSKV